MAGLLQIHQLHAKENPILNCFTDKMNYLIERIPDASAESFFRLLADEIYKIDA